MRVDSFPHGVYVRRIVEPQTFRDWLAERVGDAPKVARREIARRLVEGSGLPVSPQLVESQRRNIRRILEGKNSPRQATRDAIQAALDDYTAPSVEDESDGDPAVSIEELRRETESLTRRLNQVVKKLASSQRRSEAAA